MQLSKIYKRYTLIVLGIVLLIGSLTHYVVINYFIHRSADHTLREFRQNIEHHINGHDTLMIVDNPVLNTSRLTGVAVGPEVHKDGYFRDTLVYSDYKEEKVVYRLLSFTIESRGQNYLLTLWQATVDTEDLLLAVIVSLGLLFFLFVLFSFGLTKWLVGILWKPFYQTLGQLKEVDLETLHAVNTPDCRIDEFNTLKRVINRMLDRIQKNYIDFRELTETTAHELQTPLSVVKARLELLQQSKLNRGQNMELIHSVSSAVNRVIRLNRFMLMIARINNDQFPAIQSISLNAFLDDFLHSYEDVIEVKHLEIKKNYAKELILDLHPQMAEILVSNLLSNAIRYNIPHGHIVLETTLTEVVVSNTYGNVIPPGNLFARFNKSSQEKDATGLGLTVVKSICEKNNLEVSIGINSAIFRIRIQKNERI